MEYIVIGLLIIIIILLIVLITRKNDNSELNDKLSRTEISVIKEIGDFKHNFSSDINKDFNGLNDRIERKLNLINQKIDRCEVIYRTFFKRKCIHDLDNITPKYIFDGLVEGGFLIGDDCTHITRLTTECFYDKENPRIELEFIY